MQDSNKFFMVQSDVCVGFYNTYQEAFSAGMGILKNDLKVKSSTKISVLECQFDRNGFDRAVKNNEFNDHSSHIVILNKQDVKIEGNFVG